jgi:signal transduction histidine kinase
MVAAGRRLFFKVRPVATLIRGWFAERAEHSQGSDFMEFAQEKGHMSLTAVADEPAEQGGKPDDELLAVIGHELRGPLTAIRTALDALTRCSDDAALRGRALALLNRQTRFMADLLERLLDLSRINYGKATLRKQAVELRQLVETALETARPCIDGRNHLLDVTLPPFPVILHVDATRVQQALTNLLENAAKYTKPGGRIQLTITLESDEVVFQLRDNGIGIGADTLPHVFDLFRQSSRVAAHYHGGLGIGLALVRQIVEMHGGSVMAYSAGVGQGSEFVVRLPK